MRPFKPRAFNSRLPKYVSTCLAFSGTCGDENFLGTAWKDEETGVWDVEASGLVAGMALWRWHIRLCVAILVDFGALFMIWYLCRETSIWCDAVVEILLLASHANMILHPHPIQLHLVTNFTEHRGKLRWLILHLRYCAGLLVVDSSPFTTG